MDAGSSPSAAEKPKTPPPGPTDPAFWRSPIRGPYLTAAIGTLLLVGLLILALTGFASHTAYEPDLRGNAIVPADLPDPFGWPAGPGWLYALSQGLHVNVGLATLPFLAVKLWSVIPRLFARPPARSPAHAIERISIALLVGSAIFLFASGVANYQLWYGFDFNFLVAHYYAAVVFVASLIIHLAIKVPSMRRAWRVRDGLAPLREKALAEVTVDPVDLQHEPGLVPEKPREPTITRRGVLALAGASSATILVANAGQSIGGPLREIAFLAPRRVSGGGPNDFPVNKTFAGSEIDPTALMPVNYRLELRGPAGRRMLTLADLRAMPLTTEKLIISCVEGWSTRQTWTGVRVRDLGALVGAREPSEVFVKSLQDAVLGQASMSGDTARNDRTLLALSVNGAALSTDHGFPARIIAPALPGVHCTKWVARMEFSA